MLPCDQDNTVTFTNSTEPQVLSKGMHLCLQIIHLSPSAYAFVGLACNVVMTFKMGLIICLGILAEDDNISLVSGLSGEWQPYLEELFSDHEHFLSPTSDKIHGGENNMGAAKMHAQVTNVTPTTEPHISSDGKYYYGL